MSYRGRYQLGDYVTLTFQSVDANGVPTTPTAIPSVQIFDPNGVLQFTLQTPATDQALVTGLFQLRWFVTQGALGNWRAIFAYVIGAFSGLIEDTYEVIEGGDPRYGNVISMTYFIRPDADYIVYEVDSDISVILSENVAFGPNDVPFGAILVGRNPQL